MSLGHLKQEEIDELQKRNRSIEKQMELDEILRKMKNENNSLVTIREQIRKQELEEKEKEVKDSIRRKIREEEERKKEMELELKQK